MGQVFETYLSWKNRFDGSLPFLERTFFTDEIILRGKAIGKRIWELDLFLRKICNFSEERKRENINLFDNSSYRINPFDIYIYENGIVNEENAGM